MQESIEFLEVSLAGPSICKMKESTDWLGEFQETCLRALQGPWLLRRKMLGISDKTECAKTDQSMPGLRLCALHDEVLPSICIPVIDSF